MQSNTYNKAHICNKNNWTKKSLKHLFNGLFFKTKQPVGERYSHTGCQRGKRQHLGLWDGSGGLQVSWTAKKTNQWVLNKAGVKWKLLDTVKARKLAYYGHNMRKQGSCLEKEIMQGPMPGARRRGRPRTAWMDNIKTWTGLPVEESIRMTEDRDKWRKYVHGVANPRIKDG